MHENASFAPQLIVATIVLLLLGSPLVRYSSKYGWFSRKPTDTTTDDGLNALDRLTQQASVNLSRRKFLKKAGVGAAVAGLSVVGMAKGSSVAHADGGGIPSCSGGTYIQTNQTCRSGINECITCSTGRRNKITNYYWFQCSNNAQDRYCSTVIQYSSCGTCYV